MEPNNNTPYCCNYIHIRFKLNLLKLELPEILRYFSEIVEYSKKS